MRWLKNRDFVLLFNLLLLGAAVMAFLAVADEVSEGDIKALDEALILALRNPADLSDPIGPRWVEELFRDFTALGGWGVLTLVTLSVSGYLLLRRAYRALALSLVATLGGVTMSNLLKGYFARPRPALVAHLSYVDNPSFPSGHSMMAAVVFVTQAALLSRVFAEIPLKLYVIGVALVLMTLVGMSRVYLGVHYPSDVVAGWCAGIAWALACWVVAYQLQRKGLVEPESETGA